MPWGFGVLGEIRWGIIHQVPVILRIMASIVGPLTLAQRTVNVLC